MESIVTTLYKVSEAKLRKAIKDSESELDCIERVIIHEANSKQGRSEGKYEAISLKEKFLNVRLFSHVGVYPVRWEGFLKSISDINNLNNTIYSYILFIQVDTHYYMLTGGYGHFYISKLVDDRFGIEILERLYSEYDEKIIGLNNRSFMGNILGESKVYRRHTKVNTEKDVLKLINRSFFEVDRSKLEELGIQSDSGCIGVASSGLKFTKSLRFDDYINLIVKINKLLTQPPKMVVNMVSPVTDETAICEFELSLAEYLMEIFEMVRDGSETDMINRDVISFINAEKISIKFGNKTMMSLDGPPLEILPIMQEVNKIEALNKNNILDVVSKIKINTYIANNPKPLLHNGFLEHLSAEVTSQNRKGFYLESKWYEFKENLITQINNDFQSRFTGMMVDNLLNRKMDKGKLINNYALNNPNATRTPIEGLYNMLYINDKKTYVFDTICHNNIELCDLLIEHDGLVYLVHVKQGFSASIRELASQIVVSANLITTWCSLTSSQASSEIHEFYEKIENKYIKYGLDLKQKLKINALKRLLTNRSKIVFCLAFTDSKPDKDFLENISKYRSAIAKLAVLEVYKRLNEMDFKLKIIRIEEV